ncbi:hypothetical protein K0M31_002364 [Melipona bicolor]|uniref:Uncharacterized protein n=1 Tax=Melipona bicolor TaxID=60889 RepID=A0AA40KYL3_9HYME|nr:hypothetical protein K0M31_002364 [Melipona bicolor]
MKKISINILRNNSISPKQEKKKLNTGLANRETEPHIISRLTMATGQQWSGQRRGYAGHKRGSRRTERTPRSGTRRRSNRTEGERQEEAVGGWLVGFPSGTGAGGGEGGGFVDEVRRAQARGKKLHATAGRCRTFRCRNAAHGEFA